VTNDLDTFLTALYVEIGDHAVPPARRGRGQPEQLTDGELVCLAVAQVLLGARSEHHWLRMCYGRLGHLFPYLPHQPGYHKRLKAAAPLLAAAIDHLARQSPAGRAVARGLAGGWGDQRHGQARPEREPLPAITARARVRGGHAHPRPGDRPWMRRLR
jgi:hypothetical protein